MIVHKLTKEQFEHALSIKEPNPRKTFVQNIGVTEFSKYKYYIVEAPTGLGKSYYIYYSIQRMQKVFGNKLPYIVVVPTDDLKRDTIKLLKEFSNIQVYVVNTYAKIVNTLGEVQAAFFDEAHHYLGANSKYFSTVIPKTKSNYKMLLSATLDKNQLSLASSFGFKYKFQITPKEALQLGFIPNYICYNVLLPMSQIESNIYQDIEDNYKEYIEMFKQCVDEADVDRVGYFINQLLDRVRKKDFKIADLTAQCLGLTRGQVIGSAVNWFKQVRQRVSFIAKAKTKVDALGEILKQVEERKTLIFVNSQKEALVISKLYKDVKPYFGNALNKNLEAFKKGEVTKLVAVKKPIEGQISDDIEIVVILNHGNKDLVFIQKSGRMKRLDKENPDKQGLVINLVLDKTQDVNWAKQETKKEPFLKWVNSVEEIEELYEH